MKNYIIGIAGTKNSGKDTIASMINYIFAVGVTKANYEMWTTRRIVYDNTNSDRIIHFADPLKDVLSIIYNIPRKYFDDRKYKDEYWYCFNTNKFIENANYKSGKYFELIKLDRLKSFSISDILSQYNHKLVCIKLRTLMQYFGTDICRKYLTDVIWIKAALSKIVDKANARRLCIVPDIRFANEANAITIHNQSLYGGVIKVNRDNNDDYKHSSEIINFTVDFEINNNGTLMQLFYKVLEICQTLI